MKSRQFINTKAKEKNRVHRASSQVERRHRHHDFSMIWSITIIIITTMRTQRTTTTIAVNHRSRQIVSTTEPVKRICQHLRHTITRIIWHTLMLCLTPIHTIYTLIIPIINKRINWFHLNHPRHQIHHLPLHPLPSTRTLHHKLPLRRCLSDITITICCTIRSIIPTIGIIRQRPLVTRQWTIWITLVIIIIIWFITARRQLIEIQCT